MFAPTAWTATFANTDTGPIDTANMEIAGVEIAHVDTAVSTRPTNEDCNIAHRQASPQVVPAPAREARLAVVPVLQEVPPLRAVPPRRLAPHRPDRIIL